jgi:hypothetical protein
MAAMRSDSRSSAGPVDLAGISAVYLIANQPKSGFIGNTGFRDNDWHIKSDGDLEDRWIQGCGNILPAAAWMDVSTFRLPLKCQLLSSIRCRQQKGKSFYFQIWVYLDRISKKKLE